MIILPNLLKSKLSRLFTVRDCLFYFYSIRQKKGENDTPIYANCNNTIKLSIQRIVLIDLNCDVYAE